MITLTAGNTPPADNQTNKKEDAVMNRKQKLFLAIVLASSFTASAHAEVSQEEQLRAAQRAYQASAETYEEVAEEYEDAKEVAERVEEAAKATAAAVTCTGGNAAACAAAAAAAAATSK